MIKKFLFITLISIGLSEASDQVSSLSKRIKKEPDNNPVSLDSISPKDDELFECIKQDDEEGALKLIENGANVNYTFSVNFKSNDKGDTGSKKSLLSFAAINGKDKMINLLIQNRAKVNELDGQGCTPLTNYLYGMCCEKCPIDEKTRLKTGICQSHYDTIQLFLDNGANVNLQGPRLGVTAKEWTKYTGIFSQKKWKEILRIKDESADTTK